MTKRDKYLEEVILEQQLQIMNSFARLGILKESDCKAFYNNLNEYKHKYGNNLYNKYIHDLQKVCKLNQEKRK